MPVAQGRELLELVSALRESKAHPRLDKVFERIRDELSTSIDIVDKPPNWGGMVSVRRLAEPSELCIPSIHGLTHSREPTKFNELQGN